MSFALTCSGVITSALVNGAYTISCSVPFDQVQVSLLPDLSIDDALTLAAAISALWAMAWVFKILQRAI